MSVTASIIFFSIIAGAMTAIVLFVVAVCVSSVMISEIDAAERSEER
jgi:hypothetical protein